MAYGDWMPEFQDLWENMPVGELDQGQYDLAEYMFEEGFMTYHGESPPEDIAYAREVLGELLGEDYFDNFFDWEGWREAMGYE